MPEAPDTMVVTVGKMIGGVEKNAIAINLSIFAAARAATAVGRADQYLIPALPRPVWVDSGHSARVGNQGCTPRSPGTAQAGGPPSILRSRQNPKFLGRDDAEVVRYGIAV